jgi:hypothetical protein
MARFFGYSARVTIPFLACCLVAVLAGVSRAEDKPRLSGNWNLNPDQSDNAQAKIRDAQQHGSSRRRGSGGGYPDGGGGSPNGGGGYPDGGGGYPGGGYPGGGIGGPLGRIGIGGPLGGGIGRRGRGGMGGEREGISSQEWEELATDPKTLRIDQHERQIVISDDSGRTRILYPDGKKHKEEDVNGKKTTTKTQWEGDQLVAESKLGHSGKLTEMYRVSPDGKQLYALSRLDDPSLAVPLTIRHVYDLAKAQSQ